jgi:DNA-directed RNA polymerase subunit N (RpoN/RPB10)
MDNKLRCQSCGMPLSESFGNFGTNADGSNISEYCIICFKNGGFTNPNQTLEEMIQSSIENMTTDLGIPFEKANEIANTVIPTLGRWRKD